MSNQHKDLPTPPEELIIDIPEVPEGYSEFTINTTIADSLPHNINVPYWNAMKAWDFKVIDEFIVNTLPEVLTPDFVIREVSTFLSMTEGRLQHVVRVKGLVEAPPKASTYYQIKHALGEVCDKILVKYKSEGDVERPTELPKVKFREYDDVIQSIAKIRDVLTKKGGGFEYYLLDVPELETELNKLAVFAVQRYLF